MNSPNRTDGRGPCTKIICLGDSLTGPAPGADYLESYLKWPDLVQIGFDAAFGRGYARVINHGKAGEVSSGVCAALSERLLNHEPHIAVLWIGANNYAGNAPKAQASETLDADLRHILRRAETAGIRLLLVQYPVPRAKIMDRVWTYADAGNETIAAVAADAGVPVLGLRPVFEEAAKGMSLASLACPVDGVHLRPRGEILVAQAILEKLRTLGWPCAWPQMRF